MCEQRNGRLTRTERMRLSRQNVNNEFYTMYDDIAAELPYYKKQLKGKRIICPCDWDESFEEEIVYYNGDFVNPTNLCCEGGFIKNIDINATKKKIEKDLNLIKCNFIKFLVAHADDYEIQSISASGFDPATSKGVRFQDVDYSKYDVVITNPPFSIFDEFIDTMFSNNMKFLIIGPQNGLNFNNVFERIVSNDMWIGYHIHLTGLIKPDGTVLSKSDNLVRCCGWYTNLDVQHLHEDMILTEKYDSNKYPKYYNYDAIDVSEVKDIPYDYSGLMGVPLTLTFLNKYNPDQFEIIGKGSEVDKKYIHTTDGNYIHYIDKNTKEKIYTFPYTVTERKIGNGLRLEENGKPGSVPYGRVIIRNRKVINDDN